MPHSRLKGYTTQSINGESLAVSRDHIWLTYPVGNNGRDTS